MTTTWDTMEAMAQECRNYIDGVMSGRIRNGDPEALRRFQERMAPMLGPLSLLVLIEAWQEKNPRPVAHKSDCATNNAPAMPPGPCDCGAE